MIDISAHLRECEPCRGLLEELKAVDGLLATTRVFELPENFTFAVMAEVQTQPAPHARQHPVWSFLILYSAAAWVATVVAMALTGTAPRMVLAAVSNALSHAGVLSSSVSANLSHGIAHVVPTLAAFGAGVLAIDLAIAGAFALLYFFIRPRLAARLASFPESVS